MTADLASVKVLFLTKYPASGASSRYRVYQYLEALEKLGINCKTQSFYSEKGYKAVFLGKNKARKALAAVSAYIRRIAVVLTAGTFDMVYMQRELLPFGPLFLERWLKWRGLKLVFDYDDALFIGKPSSVSSLATRLRQPERIKTIFKMVDGVVAGNQYLKEQALPYCKNAYVLEVAEVLDRVTQRAPHQDTPAVTLGWLGSGSTEKYLHFLTPVFTRFFKNFPKARLLIVGGGSYAPVGLPVVHEPWSYEREVELIHQFDIGLMPLPLEEWSLGKCGGKARTYMAAGVPAVCTGIGYNCDLIHHHQTGMLVKSEAEWLDALTGLALDSSLRQSIADAARRVVETRFNVPDITSQMAKIIREIAG